MEQKQWVKVVAKAWADEGYKRRLMADPINVLTEEGIKVPEGITIKVVEDSEKVRTFVIPPALPAGEIEDLEERLAAGGPFPFF